MACKAEESCATQNCKPPEVRHSEDAIQEADVAMTLQEHLCAEEIAAGEDEFSESGQDWFACSPGAIPKRDQCCQDSICERVWNELEHFEFLEHGQDAKKHKEISAFDASLHPAKAGKMPPVAVEQVELFKIRELHNIQGVHDGITQSTVAKEDKLLHWARLGWVQRTPCYLYVA
ncbi:hypothetical protein C8R44DRAFT_727436 [Mycena epipterygia]|nr:hypothetical protein C8R44DRAFT_727436 [Mycena epipterygia]